MMRPTTTPLRALRRALQTPSSATRAIVRPAVQLLARGDGHGSGAANTRSLHGTRVAAAAKKKSDGNEAMLMQQMLEAMGGDDGEEAEAVDAATTSAPDGVTLPVSGVVLDVKNNIASISGLRHATLGSVIAVYNRTPLDGDDEDSAVEANDADRICRGVVLFLEKKVAHVALFRESDNAADAIRSVQIGMEVRLEDKELRVPAGLERLAGRAVNPLGEPIDLEDAASKTETEPASTALDRVSIAWGAKTVPGLMARGPFQESLSTGILAIDCLKPLAFGHRFGILGPRNSGKTRLALDIISQQVKLAKQNGTEPPHFVYVAVGKNASRVQQIVEFLEQTGALAHTTVVSADERDSLIMQYLAPFTGCALAEHFMKHGKAQRSVVVYDDLATHTTVVETLVQTMKLPKISQLSLSAHTVLMERSAQFVKPTPQSLTTLVLADTPDSATGEVSEFMERVKSIVDDAVVLESELARSRVYPPIDVLQPGASVRGPPFQSVAMWTYMQAVRTRINASFQTKENIDVSRRLGLEIEPEDAEVLEFQALVRQFFSQAPLSTRDRLEKELGVFFLSVIRLVQLPPHTAMDEIMREALTLLRDENPELLHLVETHPFGKPWTKHTEEQLEAALVRALTSLRVSKARERNGNNAPRVLSQELLRRFRRS